VSVERMVMHLRGAILNTNAIAHKQGYPNSYSYNLLGSCHWRWLLIL